MKNWEIKKLGDVTQICLGLTHTPEYTEEGVPFISVKDISSGTLSFKQTKRISRQEFEAMPWGAKPKKNDVLFCRVGTIGIPQIVETDEDFGIFVSVGFFRPYDCLYNHYLKYWLYSNMFFQQVDENVVGSTIKNLNTGWLKNFEIPLPPLEEQKRIVKILDEKFAQLETVKANAKANLQNAKDLFQSQLTKAFSNNSWEKKVLLKDIAKDFSRGKSKHRPRNDKCLFGGDYPFIQTGDIRNTEKYITEYTDTYNETGLAQSKLWPEGTLCITIAANIAETAILTFPCCFPDSVIGFVPNEDIATADYVFYLLQFFKAELQILGKGAAQDNINLGTFEKMQFPLPPLPEQKRIVEQLDSLSPKVRSLEEIYTKQLANCDELKQAFLAKAFAGEL